VSLMTEKDSRSRPSIPFCLLIIDKDSVMGHGIEMALKGLFSEIIVTSSPVKAMELLQQKEIAVILSEINFPTMNGIEFINEIRRLQSNSAILIASAHVNDQVRGNLKNVNVRLFLEKPINMTMLRKEINAIFEERNTHDKTIN